MSLPPRDWQGFSMPAEYAPHRATLMIWPVRSGSWGKDPRPAQQAFVRVFEAITRSEDLYLLAAPDQAEQARAATAGLPRVTVLEIESDDAWARDVGPTFVRNGAGELRGISWTFNAWGGLVDGLYADWEKDDAVAAAFCRALGVSCADASPFVLEGGSIHSDGEGTLLVTESCLLSAGRNPRMRREEIEKTLCAWLGAEKVLWLPRGIYQDETNEHVDNVCAFVAPATVVLAWTDNQADPQYALSRQDLEYLQSVTDARGRPLHIHKLPIPDHPILCDDADCAAYSFAPGEAVRTPGERLAASYVNFYFTNKAVLVPQFGGDNAASDARACRILAELCPDRQVIGLPAREILQGGGNIHCITQQIPGQGVSDHSDLQENG